MILIYSFLELILLVTIFYAGSRALTRNRDSVGLMIQMQITKAISKTISLTVWADK